DGKTLDVISLGGWKQIRNVTACTVPTFQLPGADVNAHPAAETSTIELTGDGDRLAFVVSHLFVTRDLAFVAPPDGVVMASAPSILAWSARSDTLDAAGTAVELVLDGETGPAFVLSGDQLRVDPGTIAFTMPVAPAGQGALRITTNVSAPVMSCDF